MNSNVRRVKTLTAFLSYVLCPAFLFFVLSCQTLAKGGSPENSTRAMDLHSYELELGKYSRLIGQSEKQPEEISEIRASLPQHWTVQQQSTEFVISTEPLNTALIDLQQHPKRAGQIVRDTQTYLDEMRQSAVEMENAPDRPSEVTARADLNTIFERREFKGLKGPSELEQVENRIERWIGGLILRLLSHLHLSAQTGNAIAWTIITLAFLAIFYWMYRNLSRRPPSQDTSATEPHLEMNDSRDWLRDAIAAANNGDYREAVHCAYWAAIARLEEVKLLKRDRSRTPRESLGLLSEHPEEQTALQKMTRHFELIWYGFRPASAEDWSEAKILLEKLDATRA